MMNTSFLSLAKSSCSSRSGLKLSSTMQSPTPDHFRFSPGKTLCVGMLCLLILVSMIMEHKPQPVLRGTRPDSDQVLEGPVRLSLSTESLQYPPVQREEEPRETNQFGEEKSQISLQTTTVDQTSDNTRELCQKANNKVTSAAKKYHGNMTMKHNTTANGGNMTMKHNTTNHHGKMKMKHNTTKIHDANFSIGSYPSVSRPPSVAKADNKAPSPFKPRTGGCVGKPKKANASMTRSPSYATILQPTKHSMTQSPAMSPSVVLTRSLSPSRAPSISKTERPLSTAHNDTIDELGGLDSSTTPRKTTWPELMHVNATHARQIILSENSNVKECIILPLGSFVIMDFREDRVWLFVDENNLVAKIPSVG